MNIVQRIKTWRYLRRAPASTAYTYYARDHTGWGDRIEVRRIVDVNQYDIVGWLWRLPNVGDRIVFDTNVPGATITTVVKSVKYMRDPPDMFFATVRRVYE